MSLHHGWKRASVVALTFLAVWLCLRYLFPLFLPFLLGLAISLSAEPFSFFLQEKLRWRRSCAAAAAVTGFLLVAVSALWLLGATAVERAMHLAGSLGGAAEQLSAGFETVRIWAVSLASKAPGGLAQPLTASVEELFQGGGALLHRGADAALSLAGQAAQRLPDSLVTLGTAVLAAYMISARLPRLIARFTAIPLWRKRLRPALLRLKNTGKCWLRAQVRLSAVTFGIVLGGLVLLGVYLTALLTRSSLEPRLLGRQLGLDPLAALMALYAGYRIWGFGGMILAPILTVTARELCRRD